MVGRLHKSAEFERVRTHGKRRRGTYCLINFAPAAAPTSTHSASTSATNGAPQSIDTAIDAENTNTNGALTRIGYITSKKVGNAVQRNRARRLMREAVRALSDQMMPGWDVVLVAQSALAQPNLKMPVLQSELEWLLKQASILRTPPPSRQTPSKDNLLSRSSPDVASSEGP